jgi:S-adenosylmethionine decarboxylase
VVLVHDLAPDILRQRLIIEGRFTIDVDEPVIREFFDHFTRGMGFRTYGAPTIFAPAGDGRAENQGYDAFVPLIDSGISLYVWSAPRFLAIVIFTCKLFDADTAVSLARDYFAMPELEHSVF